MSSTRPLIGMHVLALPSPPPPLHGPLLPGTLFGMASPWFPPTKSGHTTWPQAIPTKTSTRCHGGH